MRSFTILVSVVAIAMGCLASPVRADDRDTCNNPSAEAALQACTRAIESRKFSGSELAGLYCTRAILWNTKGGYDQAISDTTEAIRINPKDTCAYANRGSAYGAKGEHDKAIADATESIRLDPKMPSWYIRRGHYYRSKGEFDKAIADATEAIRLSNRHYASYATDARALLDSTRAYLAKAKSQPAVDQLTKSRPTVDQLTVAKLEPPAAPSRTDSATPLPVKTSERRIALVIGNSAYQNVAVLPNPTRDAGAVAATLRQIGFQTVTLHTDLGKEKLVAALKAFAQQADGADWALVYYAGHGIEMNRANYLIPIDAKLATDRDVDYEAVPLDHVMTAVGGAKRMRLVLLDACRDNPFARQIRRTIATRSIGRGLASIEPEVGTLVVYAAKDGATAEDGEGANSPFATALIKQLTTPGLEIRRLFDLVRDDVVEMTGRRQQPFSYGSVSGRQDFYFVSK